MYEVIIIILGWQMLLDCSGSDYDVLRLVAGAPVRNPCDLVWGIHIGHPVRLFDLEQLDVEGEGGVGRNDAGVATATVGIVRRANQLGALADAQLGNSLIPATDDLALADGELEWLVAVARRIELRGIQGGSLAGDGEDRDSYSPWCHRPGCRCSGP